MQSLSRTYNRLTGNAWEGPNSPGSFATNSDHSPPRPDIAGPRIKVHAKAAQTIALAIHELATNAAKYGALSVPQGAVSVHWSISGDPKAPTFTFSWHERGGPTVRPPKKGGFGSSITDHVVAFEFGTRPVHDCAFEGVRYEFSTALSKVGGTPSPSEPGTNAEFVR